MTYPFTGPLPKLAVSGTVLTMIGSLDTLS